MNIVAIVQHGSSLAVLHLLLVLNVVGTLKGELPDIGRANFSKAAQIDCHDPGIVLVIGRSPGQGNSLSM